jgi:hypothetical protein
MVIALHETWVFVFMAPGISAGPEQSHMPVVLLSIGLWVALLPAHPPAPYCLCLSKSELEYLDAGFQWLTTAREALHGA